MQRKGTTKVDALKQWGQVMRASGASEATIRTRTMTVRSLCTHAGITDPLDATRADAVAFLAGCRSQWTRCTYYASLRQWCAYLTAFGIPHEDLLAGIMRPRQPSAVARPITDEQVRRLLSMPMPPRQSAFVKLALYQALRVHEIAKIRAEEVDPAGWLTVTGKGGYSAVIPLHAEIAALAGWMPEAGYWFPSRAPNAPVAPYVAARSIRAALLAAGIDATAHQLRDTAATRIQREVRNMRVTQSMLRHRRITSTAKYVEVSDREMQGASARLAW